MRTASCAKPLVRHFEALYLRRLVDAHAHTHTHLYTHARAVARTSRTRHNVQLTQMTCLCGILLSAKLKAAQTLRASSFVAQLKLTARRQRAVRAGQKTFWVAHFAATKRHVKP